MAIKNITDNKKNGIYYTPQLIARVLVKPLINKSGLKIFDPAYGNGSLLLSAENVLKKLNSSRYKNNLYGCDISPENGQLNHLSYSKLFKLDFFEFSYDNKFDVILMNPPYVRHHLIDKDKREFYKGKIKDIHKIKETSDLWAYFLAKSIGHLNFNGSIGAILPWSFLQAEYSCAIRALLTDNFSDIKILALGAEYFDDAQERIVLVWLKGYGEPAKKIKIAFTQHITDDFEYFNLTKDQFCSQNISFSNKYDIEKILERYKSEYNFKEFESYANVLIGVVTGADKFFILNIDKAKEYGISKKYLIPILTNANLFAGLFLNGNFPAKRLLKLSQNNIHFYDQYIKHGIDEQYHLRAHSLNRDPWYTVKVGKTPDAFFPYRVSKFPYLVINNKNVQCTNSIHRIYFKNLTVTEQKWMQISLLSAPAQLSLEFYSRVYGQGVLKIEPGALKKTLAYKDNDKSIDRVYDEISNFLSSNRKNDAVKLATDIINKKLNIPAKLSNWAKAALLELQNRRLNR